MFQRTLIESLFAHPSAAQTCPCSGPLHTPEFQDPVASAPVTTLPPIWLATFHRNALQRTMTAPK